MRIKFLVIPLVMLFGTACDDTREIRKSSDQETVHEIDPSRYPINNPELLEPK